MLLLQAVYTSQVQGDRGGPLQEFFKSSEIADLPPKLRAVFEENKVCAGMVTGWGLHVCVMDAQLCAWPCSPTSSMHA